MRFQKNKAVFLAVIALILGIVIAGCGNKKQAASRGENSTAASGAVEFKYPKNPGFDLVYIADALGYWEGSGVKPKYVGAVSAPQLIPSVATGAIDMATRHIPLTMTAIAGGSDVQVISAGTQTTPNYPHMKYFVRADSGIYTVKDLVGKKIGVNSFGACSEFVTKKYIKDNGLEDKVKLVVIANDQLEQSLRQGLIDVAIIHPPDSGRAERAPELRKLWSDWDLDGGVSGMCPYTVNGKFLRAHPEAAKAIAGVLAKTANWVNANPAEARAIIAKMLNMDVELVEGYSYYQDGVIQDQAVQYWLERLEAEGQIEKGKWKTANFYTNEFNANK